MKNKHTHFLARRSTVRSIPKNVSLFFPFVADIEALREKKLKNSLDAEVAREMFELAVLSALRGFGLWRKNELVDYDFSTDV